MSAIERYPDEFDRMPHYGAEGCVCGSIATPDRTCPLHAANWIIERLESDLRRAASEVEQLRLWINLTGRSCPSHGSIDAVLARSKSRFPVAGDSSG